MATTKTLTGDLEALVDDVNFATLRVWITFDQPRLTDPDTGKTKLGAIEVIRDEDDATTFTADLPDNSWDPSPHWFRVHVQYRTLSFGDLQKWVSREFQMDVDKDLAALPTELPRAVDEAEYATFFDLIAQADAARVAAAEAQAAAEEARDGAVAVATGDLVPALGALGLPQSGSALSASYGPVRGREIRVERERLVGDTDSQALQRAVNVAIASGAKRIILPKSYTLSSTRMNLAGLHGVTFDGEGPGRTVISAATAVGSAVTTDGACSDIAFRGVSFVGNVVDDVSLSAPRRSRTTSGSSFINAILLRGNGDPRAGSPAYEVRNLRLEDVEFLSVSSLPIFVQGVRGEVELHHVRVENCYDPGFIYCDVVKAYDFTSRKSADNGISFSRGNGRAIIDGFDIEGCAYHGIWASGYEADGSITDVGPTEVTIGNGIIKTAGMDGIQLFNAPQKVVVGNVLVDGCQRGPSDEAQDQAGVGIKIGGFPYNTPSAITVQASDIQIGTVTLVDCARGGIHLRGVTDAKIDGALIVNPGSQYYHDGSTTVSSGNLDENFGVAVDAGFPTTVIRPSVRNVRTIDTRTTPLLNFGVNLGGSVAPDYSDNTVSGAARNPQQYDGAVVANAPTGSFVRHRWMRDGAPAFDISLNTSNELELAGRNLSDGSQLGPWMTIGRVSGKTTMGGALSLRRNAVAAAASLTFDANLYNHFSVTLSGTAVTSSSISNASTGQQLTITVIQDATGGRTFTWPTNCKFAAAAAPSDTTASRRTSVTFSYDGTNWNEVSRAVAVG